MTRPKHEAGRSPGRFGPIFDPTRSVVLVASAGTGKTWRLVRRYLRIIAGVERAGAPAWARPDQVVAVTFTRAAAAEMRARVFGALTTSSVEQIDQDDDPVLQEILQLRPLAERLALAEHVAPAPIGTLHSLCARMLSEFPELSGVPPDARPLEPAEQILELDAFVSGWLDRAIDDPSHRAHAACVELLGAHPLGFIRRELRAMVDDRDWSLIHARPDPQPTSSPDPHPTSSAQVLEADWREPDAIQAARAHFVRTQWRDYMRFMQAPLALLFQACAMASQQARLTPKQTQLRDLTGQLLRHHVPEPDLERVVSDVKELVTMRPSAELGPLGAALQHVRNSHKVLSTRRSRDVLPDPHGSLERGQAKHLARWVALAALARADWAVSLRERAVLRYDDLELLTWALLDDPRAQVHLRGRYRHVLVDEYQDINPTQAQIIDRLAELCGEDGPAKVFFVGDPKQSIYRFRGADPQVFQRAVALRGGGASELRDQDEPLEVADIVTLAENRRSSPTLARFFMQLFPPLFAGVLPWANITELGRPFELARLRDVLDHALVQWDGEIVITRAQDRLPGLGVDLLIRDRARASDHAALVDEAERVAAHLRGLIDGATQQTSEGAAPVQLRARDLAILVPRWSLAEGYRAALERRGIAADLAGGRGLLLLPEVRDLINLVRLWADEHDEMAALAVLRGPCFAISDLGLYVLARWPGVDRRVREADPDLPEFADLDEVWEPWDDEDEQPDGQDGQDEPQTPSWPRRFPRRIREVLRHGRLDPARALAALEAAGVIATEKDETSADAHARLLAQLQADARALEAGRARSLALMRQAGARASADLLADAIAGFFLEAHWLAGPRGRRAVANAWRFVEHARTLEHDGPDLQRLSTWLDAGAEPAAEGLISPEADAVTITTWHGAKGKEWPVVVLAGIGEFREAGARTSWSGAPIPTIDGERDERINVPRIRQPHQGFSAPPDPLHAPCTNMLAPLEAAEAKRLLYVAMTRARDRLVLSGEADARAHVHYDDKPWLGLEYRFDMGPLIGEPKPAYLCKRPIELLTAALDLPAAKGTPVLRPRAATWSLAHLRVIDDAMLLAGLERGHPSAAEPVADLLSARARASPPLAGASEGSEVSTPTPGQAPEPEPEPEPKPEPPRPVSKRRRAPKTHPDQLGFAAFFTDPPAPEPPAPEPAPERAPDPPPPASPWLAGPTMQLWTPSAGRAPWPVSELEWDMPLPARRPALLDDEDPRALGDLFHRAMERWDFEGEPPRSADLTGMVAVTHAARDPSERRRITTWLVRCIELFAEDQPLLDELREARARGQLFHEVDINALVGEATRDHWISGRIDLLWRDGEGLWNVLDYKVTSKVRSRAQMQELQWEYGPQLLLYREALARWRPRGEVQYLGRFGLWLAPAGKPMWLISKISADAQ
ncbi:ATP-dependent DNA helicase, UvrD/REP family protein [Enhygromyxa salina]|uniref:DNA 3'-5' helicase n=1 Tax=Enhygromyxa salina TaxID=215803 RepID=A0A0C2CZX9_9BACT|nr:UvrD-helicase domain-containing protein [Enhygromyxa salina]KIG13432.1 ATP-dependent DNA helicase, UvrD/REP family protein [Enhygromyxa salina]